LADKNPVDRTSAPRNYEGIVNRITESYPTFPAASQQIARFITQNPNVVALESINAVAVKCGVHASSLVRFAQNIGYSGFKELQSIFQTRLATAAPGFRERIRALEGELSRNVEHSNRGHLRDLVVRDTAALQTLLETVSEESLSETARLLTEAETIYVAGQLRSEPIALLLRYLLTMLRRRVVMLDPAGGLAQEMAITMTARDVLVVVAFRHYAKEVVAIAELAAGIGTPMIAITDSQLSPLAKDAQVLFKIPEEEYSFSRSLAAPMCLIQCIAVVTAARLQPERTTPPRIPTVTEMALNRNDESQPKPRRGARRRVRQA
jgi:DNA-binding MurR/RpiR family transcriptional regulator